LKQEATIIAPRLDRHNQNYLKPASEKGARARQRRTSLRAILVLDILIENLGYFKKLFYTRRTRPPETKDNNVKRS
jgi:hypothetical protein